MENVVYVIEVFDLFHTVHIALLRRSKEMGDKLIVEANGDAMVASYKREPFVVEEDRLEIIKACRYVDEAFIIKEYDNKEYIEKYKVNKIVHGDDWEGNSYMEQIRVTPAYLEEQNCELVLLPYTSGISTSDLIQKIKSS